MILTQVTSPARANCFSFSYNLFGLFLYQLFGHSSGFIFRSRRPAGIWTAAPSPRHKETALAPQL
jgi:hypothetical protein